MIYTNYEDLRKAVDVKADVREDHVINSNNFIMNNNLTGTLSGEDYGLSNTFHSHLAHRLRIPKSYYDRIRKDQPELLANSVNALNDNKNRLFRFYKNEGKTEIRGMLSDRYKIMDNKELLDYLEPHFESKKMVLLEGQLDDSYMSLKVRFPDLKGQPKQGDTCYGGIYLRNSEVGLSSLTFQTLVYRLVCTNGLMLPKADSFQNSFHLGKRNEIGIRPNYIIPDVVCNQIDESITKLNNKTDFIDNIERLKLATRTPVSKLDFDKVKSEYTLNDKEMEIFELEYNKEKDGSLYGVIQAFTGTGRAMRNSRTLYLEKTGGDLLTNRSLVEKLVA